MQRTIKIFEDDKIILKKYIFTHLLHTKRVSDIIIVQFNFFRQIFTSCLPIKIKKKELVKFRNDTIKCINKKYSNKGGAVN